MSEQDKKIVIQIGLKGTPNKLLKRISVITAYLQGCHSPSTQPENQNIQRKSRTQYWTDIWNYKTNLVNGSEATMAELVELGEEIGRDL